MRFAFTSHPFTGFSAGDLQACSQIIRTHASTFYLATLLLPPRERAAVHAIYAVCRLGDDAVDDGPTQARALHLQQWWDGVQNAFHGTPSDQGVWRMLAWAHQEHHLPLHAFAEMHQAFAGDLQQKTPQTLSELEHYCRGVAGVVGLMVLPVLCPSPHPLAARAAVRLGQAMQLTNILRDVGEDWRNGRVYLPKAVLDRHGLDPRTFGEGKVGRVHQQVMQEMTALARTWYREARAGLPHLHPRCRFAVQVALQVYGGILDDLEKHGFDNLNRRSHVPGWKKAVLVLQSLGQKS